MNLRFSKQNEVKKLSRPVWEYMRQKFMLSETYLNELRCFEYEDSINERQIMRILVFHPRPVRARHITLRTRADLEKNRELILYEGYEDDTRGSLYIGDKRIINKKDVS